MFTKDDYSNGAIIKIIFHDFLTYHHVECVPGPYMNVIIGPNGTGKSTIICGICLASGGTPKMLGRSDNKGDFIRHGKVEGFVEMHLKDNKAKDGVKIFKISLRQPNTAIYYIDAKRVTLLEVQNEIAKYNIQVDNPCTFLAQDKVKSFAEQDSRGLLVNTMKAGPIELMKTHADLIRKQETKNNQDTEKGQLEKDYKTLVEKLKKTRELAEKYLERRKANKRLLTFKAKQVCLKLDAEMEDYEKKLTSLNEAKKLYKEYEDRKRPLADKLNKVKPEQERLNRQKYSKEEKLHDCNMSVRSRLETLKKYFSDDELRRAKKRYNDQKVLYNDWEKEMRKHEDLLMSAEEGLKQAQEEPFDETPLKEKKEDYDIAKKRLFSDENAIERRLRNLINEKDKLEREAEKIQIAFQTKFNSIRNFLRGDAASAWNYYMNNRRLFKYPVYVPFLFMQVDKEYHVMWNNILGVRDATAFIFGCREDESILLRQKKFRINSTIVDQHLIDKFAVDYYLPDHLRNAGFKDYVINTCKTVPPVKAYLTAVNSLHTVPVGGYDIDRNCEQVGHRFKNEIRLFMTDRTRVEVFVSRYDPSKVTISRSPFQSRNSIFTELHTYAFEQEETPASQRTSEEMKIVTKEKESLIQRREELGRFQAEIRKLESEKINYQDRIKIASDFAIKAKRKLQDEKRNRPDIESAKKELDEIEKISKNKMPKQFKFVAEAVENLSKVIKDVGLIDNKRKKIGKLNQMLRENLENIENESYELMNRLHDLEQQESIARNRLKEIKEELYYISKCSSTKREELEDNELQNYDKMLKDFEEYNVPNDPIEVEEEITSAEAMINAKEREGTRHDVEKLKELEELELKERKRKEEFENKVANWEDDMKNLVNQWIEPLEKFVEKISLNYMNYFNKIGCAGEVRLHQPDNPLDINEYGIDIYVQFIGYNKMTRLTAQQQSGGERSVATMLYLMALQELCPVPFRCVDEINQGMDAINERKVFNMMVDLLSDNENTLSHSQYFILTPKLLPGLHFNDKVAVLIVQNTPMMTKDPGILRVSGVEIQV